MAASGHQLDQKPQAGCGTPLACLPQDVLCWQKHHGVHSPTTSRMFAPQAVKQKGKKSTQKPPQQPFYAALVLSFLRHQSAQEVRERSADDDI